MLSTDRQGAIAETAIAHEAIKLGIDVYRPLVEGGRFDIIFAFPDGRLARVQWKWATLARRSDRAGRAGRRPSAHPSARRARAERADRPGKLRSRIRAGGYSSVGRAFGWQPKGRGFESP